MIIYQATVNEFKKDVEDNNIEAIISNNLYTKFGIKVGNSEKRSWTNSLPHVLNLLTINKNDYRVVLCEFNIPTSKKRIDFIVLGQNKVNKPSAWIIELKQWSSVTQEEINMFKVGRYMDSHPSYQAQDYKYRLNHKMGLVDLVDIQASAFLHNLHDKESVLFNDEYTEILSQIALFSHWDKSKLSLLVNNHTMHGSGTAAKEFFKSANWRPSVQFLELVKNNFDDLTLVGSQKIIYEQIEEFVRTSETSKQKLTFLISGDPGSGKTVMAFKLLNLITLHFSLKMQMMVPGQEVREAFKHKLINHVLSSKICGSNMHLGYDSVIIDEAHKAVGRDYGNINYQNNYKQLEFAIIFIDDDQVINKKGITKDEVKRIAISNGHKVHEYNIEENFRALGERTLLDWIDYVFYNRSTISGEFEYKQVKYNNNYQKYKLYGYGSPKKFTDSYFNTRQLHKNTRIVSLWHEGYYIGEADINGLPKATFTIGDEPFIWNPNTEWANQVSKNNKSFLSTYNNHVKKYMNDRKLFLTGKPNVRFIAYFNHIQGYEFDNIFVYIPNVFTYENNIILFHRDRLASEVRSSQTWAPNSGSPKLKNKTQNQIYEINKRFFINRIKVMLTRGVYSTHIYAEDSNLNNYINSKIISDNN